jgi:hypothetical protein
LKLYHSKIQSLQFKPIIDLHESSGNKNIEIISNLNNNINIDVGETMSIHQLFYNIVVNAVSTDQKTVSQSKAEMSKFNDKASLVIITKILACGHSLMSIKNILTKFYQVVCIRNK